MYFLLWKDVYILKNTYFIFIVIYLFIYRYVVCNKISIMYTCNMIRQMNLIFIMILCYKSSK
jgi:hypothetical protein